MEKNMSLEDLSSIKGAVSSPVIEKIFQTIKNVNAMQWAEKHYNQNSIFDVSQLREDKATSCPESEKSLIRKAFPKEKNGFLVVQKVID